ncbi:MAG TPA: hypothetical protein VF993_08395 [Myxococcales bacterium]
MTAQKKKLFFFPLAALPLLAGCAQQDAAALVTHKDWCFQNPGCEALPQQTALSGTFTVVQSGASHPHVKINAILYKGAAVVGAGVATADFASGRTVEVTLALTSR